VCFCIYPTWSQSLHDSCWSKLSLQNCVRHGQIQDVIPVQTSVDACTSNRSLKLQFSKVFMLRARFIICWGALLSRDVQFCGSRPTTIHAEKFWSGCVQEEWAHRYRGNTFRSASANWDYRWQENCSSMNMPVKIYAVIESVLKYIPDSRNMKIYVLFSLTELFLPTPYWTFVEQNTSLARH